MSNTPPIPTYNDQIVAQGLARLTSAYQSQPNIRAWLAVLLQPWQDLEDATFGVMTGRLLTDATVYELPQTNFVFDVLGALIGQVRGGLSDADLKAIILLRIAANRSRARITDWSNFAAILAPFCDDVPIFYGDQGGVYFGCWNLQLPPITVAAVLGRGVGNGIGADLAYTVWPDGNDFEWSSAYDAAAGQGTWGSAYAPWAGGLWVAGQQMQ